MALDELARGLESACSLLHRTNPPFFTGDVIRFDPNFMRQFMNLRDGGDLIDDDSFHQSWLWTRWFGAGQGPALQSINQ